jgi:hypothetical protein
MIFWDSEEAVADIEYWVQISGHQDLQEDFHHLLLPP